VHPGGDPLLGLIAMMPVLVIYSDLVAILGGASSR